jgi:flagellar motor switch protein FliN/FliY
MIDRNRQPSGDQLELCIELGRAHVPHDQAAALGQGSVVTLDAMVDQAVDIKAGGRLIARGEVLELDGSFCVRVTELVASREAAR